MKCPKCGYLGFETSDRCRNCGYDFSLAVGVEPPPELPLRSSEHPGGPLADFDLGDADVAARSGATPNLDLDRIIGASSAPTPSRAGGPLPLFPSDAVDDAPITTPRPARPPLVVRRTTPEVQRGRPRPAPPQLEMIDEESASEARAPVPEQALPRRGVDLRSIDVELEPASAIARLVAAVIDLALLAIIDAVVVYLTLALTGLDRESIAILPLAPLAGFLAILNGGYLVVFVAASGQTAGKMVTGIRVIGDDGRRVDVGGAVLRAVGCGLSLLTAGLGYLPAFVTANGRALQDRIAGTRVVSAR
jgi:uncharacterized RDD family membrane protein YckC